MGLLGIGVFFAVGLIVAVRLLMLWLNTRERPELYAALALLGIGPLGFCVLVAGYAPLRGTSAMYPVVVTGWALQDLGFLAAALFSWELFHPRSFWARAAAVLGGVGPLCVWALLWLAHLIPMWAAFHADFAFKILGLAWGAFEAFRYWRLMRVRVALGAADPLVSASLAMWGLTAAAAAVAFTIMYVSVLFVGIAQPPPTAIQLVLSACGLVTATALLLAFLPPQPYTRFVTARAAERPT